jgi:hypothetical protein
MVPQVHVIDTNLAIDLYANGSRLWARSREYGKTPPRRHRLGQSPLPTIRLVGRPLNSCKLILTPFRGFDIDCPFYTKLLPPREAQSIHIASASPGPSSLLTVALNEL